MFRSCCLLPDLHETILFIGTERTFSIDPASITHKMRRPTMAQITLAKALKVKNRLAGRLAKVQADIQAFNSVPAGQADQVNVPALMRAREELVEALVGLKTAISDANREVQRDIYDLAEKKATAQFLAGVN